MDNNEKFNQLIGCSCVNINGVVQTAADAKISVFDRGFLYGDSVYDVTYSDKGCIIFLEEHLDRLFNSAKLIDLNIDLTRSQIIEETIKTLNFSKLTRAYIRIIITRGEADMSLDPSVCFKNNLVIIVKPQPPYPQELYLKGLFLHIPKIERMNKKAVNPNAKSGNYLNNVLAMNEAKKFGADDALMLNADGFITEGTSFNIWIVKNGTIATPPLESGLLKGITRQKVIQICRDHNLKLELKNLTKEDIYECDEAFITSSTKGLMPVYRIDHIFLSDAPEKRPLSQTLNNYYQELLIDQMSRFKSSGLN